MKFRSKAIISAVVSASLMLAGAVGGTIAFFTTSSETNVNVTSGKIAVSTVVSDLKTYSLEQEQPAGTFENGGTAVLNAGTQVITLDRMTPGDKATFKIAVSIENNVKVKYRVVFDKTGDLAPALVANVSGGASEWTMINPAENPTAVNLDGSVELPLSTSINYADKAGSVKILVEAVQGNMPTTVSSARELEDAIANIPDEGGEVSLYLSKDITLSKVLEMPSNANVTIHGDGNTKIESASGADRAINFKDVSNSTLTLAGVDVVGGSERGISMVRTTDCTVNLVNSSLENDDYYAINLASGNSNAVINIEGSNVKGWSALNVWSSGTTINVKDSVLTGVDKHDGTSNAFGTIVINNGAQNVKLNLENSVINSVQNGDQFQAFFLVNDLGFKITSVNTTYNYTRPDAGQPESYASIEEVLDYNSFIRKYKEETSSYDGVSYQRLVYEEGESAKACPFFYENAFENTAPVADASAYFVPEVAQVLKEAWDSSYSVSSTKVNGLQFVVADYIY